METPIAGETGTTATAARLPRTVWVLGLVSLLMDSSSELIHGLLPVFLVGVLGASALQVGLIEGVAEATAAVGKLFSGALSDAIGRRKPLLLAGYGFAALTKPLFPLAQGPGTVLLARFLDRVGKGIRGAPRDALIADVTLPQVRGRAYGLRQALDTVGAVAGPLAAIGLMWWFADDVRSVLWFAVLPAIAAVVLLAFAVEEPPHGVARGFRLPLHIRDLARLPRAFWAVLTLAALGTLARFSEAFLILKLEAVGLGLGLTPAVLLLMSLVYAIGAYPAGVLADRLDRDRLLAAAFAVLVAADLVLASAGDLSTGFVGVALWGLHMALSQGLLSALVADAAPAELRGTAFGIYHLASGLALLAASLIAGWLWDRTGIASAFGFGAVMAAAACTGLVAGRRLLRA